MIVWSMICRTLLLRDHNSLINLFHRIIWTLIIINFAPVIVKGQITNHEPERLSANLGDNMVLNCAFDFPGDIPVPYVVQWQKNGVKIPIYIWYDGYPPHIGEGYEGRVSLSGKSSLNLSSVRESDHGWYECKVYFLNRPPEPIKNGTWIHLDVHAPPHFNLKPPDVVYVKVGESLTLPCEAQGTPPPAIIWYKDNLPLDGTAAIHILPHELRITSLQQSDIGDYLCTARNQKGSVTATTKVIVAGPAVITAPPRNITKIEGDKIELICEAKALPSNVSHRWYHNGVEISQLSWLETRTVIKRDGTLFINPTSSEDTGKYTCEVFNGIGNPDSASGYLSIEYPARVTYSPMIQYLPHGLSGIVRCFIQASPPFQFITWTKDRRPFDPNSTPGVVTLNNGSLLFQRVSHEHQGRYRCTPYNLHGTSGTSNVMEVLVREPPKFTLKPNEVYQKTVNSEVKMPCDGTGQPKPSITWRKADGNKLPKERSFLRAGNLTIKSIKKDDHGIYECVLENEIAVLVTSALLLVNSTTPHAPTNISVNTSAFAATVTWLPNYNGGYEQTFHLRYRFSDQGDTDWKAIRIPPPESSTAFTLYNLQSDTDYDFQVFASNLLGTGLASPIVRARTKTWDLEKGIYPTDAYGATYIPTVQKPSGTPRVRVFATSPATNPVTIGPKPGHPRNVTIEKMAQGWVIAWHPPFNRTIAVAYYRVEYREGDTPWQYSEPVSKDTAYLIKNLKTGIKYTFRVWAYSIFGVGEVSQPLEYKISDPGGGIKGARAITAGIVGSVLFFVTAIVLSVCGVKICNKRKRRKMEKAYMMVSCPMMDGVNGGHSHSGSPVPLKQTRTENRRISGLMLPLSIRNLLLRFGGQFNGDRRRSAAEPRQIAGRSSSPQPYSGIEISNDWPDSGGPIHGTSPHERRRVMKNVRYNVEMGHSRPLGWISRSSDGKFIIKGIHGSYDHDHSHMYDLTPSNQASVRGSFRSDGSGQSGPQPQVPPHRQYQTHGVLGRTALHSSLPSRTFRSPQSQQFSSLTPGQITTIYRPRDTRFRTSSPGPGLVPESLIMDEELSSVRRGSSFERSTSGHASGHIPISSLSLRSQLHELPSLRPIHEHLRQHHQQQYIPVNLRATVPLPRQQYTHPNFRPIHHHHGPLLLETVPEAIYDSAPSTHSPVFRTHRNIGMDTGQWPERSDVQRQMPQSRVQQPMGSSIGASVHRPYQNVPFPRHLASLPLTQMLHRQMQRNDLIGTNVGATVGAHEPDSGDRIRFAAPPKMVYKKPRNAPPPPPLPLPSPLSPPPLPETEPPDDDEVTDVKRPFDSNNNTLASDSSNDQTFAYTRDRLLGAVEKVRSGMLLTRASPFLHTPSMNTPRGTPVDPNIVRGIHRHTPIRVTSEDLGGDTDNEVFVDDFGPSDTTMKSRIRHVSPSRASIISASSGRGSSGHDGSAKHTPGRGDSYIHGEPTGTSSGTSLGTVQDKTGTSNSSGFASRTLSSQLQSSTSPGQSSGISASSTSVPLVPRLIRNLPQRTHPIPYVNYPPVQSVSRFQLHSHIPQQQRPVIESPQSEPIFPSYAQPMEPLDVSVDENYEFDSVSPLETEHIEKLRREQSQWRQLQENPQFIPQSSQYHQQTQMRGPFSDSELYSTLSSSSRKRYDDTEARCAALKEEFLRFRHRQQLLQQQQEQSSSDEFESAC